MMVFTGSASYADNDAFRRGRLTKPLNAIATKDVDVAAHVMAAFSALSRSERNEATDEWRHSQSAGELMMLKI